MWKVLTTSEFDRWFASQEEAVQAVVIGRVSALQERGPSLRRPHADTLSGSKYPNMKELRASTATAVIRIAFAFDPERSAIVLCAGDKTGVSQRLFYHGLIAKADPLYRAHLAAIARKRRGKG